jgi:glycosyltransferase involved in cell wall biosynthesis
MLNPTVSIGITTFNRRKMVIRAIKSVLAQDWPEPIEIVVIDDGSTDRTTETVGTEYGGRVSYFRYRKNGGIAFAKNAALLRCTGSLRGILDSDDYYAPGFVRACVEALQRHPEAGVVYTDNVLVNSDQRKLQDWPAQEWGLEEMLRTRNIRGDSWLARWEILAKTKLHDPRFKLEVDYDLFYQLAELTSFVRVPRPLHFVSQHGGRASFRNGLESAFWHAAGLGKYRHSIKYAFSRAEQFGKLNEWRRKIEEGYRFGMSCRDAG